MIFEKEPIRDAANENTHTTVEISPGNCGKKPKRKCVLKVSEHLFIIFAKYKKSVNQSRTLSDRDLQRLRDVIDVVETISPDHPRSRFESCNNSVNDNNQDDYGNRH